MQLATLPTAPAAPEPPFVPGLPILGNTFQLKDPTGVPTAFMVNAAREYGDVVGLTAAGTRIYLLSHPDLVHEVLVERVNEFHKPIVTSERPQTLDRFLGEGILTADHAAWRPQRKLIQPLMHTKHIESYATTMTHFGEKLVASWTEGEVRNIHADMMQVTLWIISETMFGTESTHTKDLEHLARIAQHIAISDTMMPLPTILSGGRDRQAAEINTKLTELVDSLLDQRETGDRTDRSDLLSLLLNTVDENGQPASREFVQDNILTLFFAGHETTANTLTWTLYYLDQHPEVRARLIAELDAVLAGRTPTLADLKQLPYTLQVIKETMRIEPTVSSVPRYITEDLELGGMLLKGHSTVMLPIYTLHHDPRWWTEPERFDPDRFSAENEPKIPKYAYLPFGGGPRVCIGNHFALMEAQLLLAIIAGRYELHLEPGTDATPLRQITTMPQHELYMRVHQRA